MGIMVIITHLLTRQWELRMWSVRDCLPDFTDWQTIFAVIKPFPLIRPEAGLAESTASANEEGCASSSD